MNGSGSRLLVVRGGSAFVAFWRWIGFPEPVTICLYPTFFPLDSPVEAVEVVVGFDQGLDDHELPCFLVL